MLTGTSGENFLQVSRISLSTFLIISNDNLNFIAQCHDDLGYSSRQGPDSFIRRRCSFSENISPAIHATWPLIWSLNRVIIYAAGIEITNDGVRRVSTLHLLLASQDGGSLAIFPARARVCVYPGARCMMILLSVSTLSWSSASPRIRDTGWLSAD